MFIIVQSWFAVAPVTNYTTSENKIMAFTMSVLFICVFIGTVCGIPVNLTDGLAHETAYSSRTGVQSLEDNSTDSSNDSMILNLVNNDIDSDEAMAADEVGEDSPYEWLNLHFADLSQVGR